MPAAVILVAAGRGRRFGSRSSQPKQFLPLCGRPLVYWSLKAFEKSPAVRFVCVVVPGGRERYVHGLARRWGLKKVRAVISGGRERHDSVRAGLERIPAGFDVVLIHDAARPLVSPDVVARVVSAARRSGAALAAWPVTDTLKSQKTGVLRVNKTVPRDGLWLAQTPQGFRRDWAPLLLRRMDGATDDVQAAERAGRPVEIVPGSPRNIKVTRPEDMKICEALLERP